MLAEPAGAALNKHKPNNAMPKG